MRTALSLLDPTPRLLEGGGRRPPSYSVASVYRERNAHHVAELIGVAHPTDVALWALDGVAPELKSATRGSGTGTRFELINRLCTTLRPTEYVVVVDDDVRVLGSRTLDHVVELAHRFELDIAQPAHGVKSPHGHAICSRVPLSSVRITNFVDIGPMLVIGPRRRDLLLPFPEGRGMGWGVELDWMDLADAGTIRVGIIDAIPVRHLAPIGMAYEPVGEGQRVSAQLAERGATEWADVQLVFRTVRPWRRPRPSGRSPGNRCSV